MNTVKQIQKLIDSIESVEDLRQIGHVLNARVKTVQCLKAMSFQKGQKVLVSSPKMGGTFEATIVKVNTKSVDINGPKIGNWRVSPSMLKAA